MESLSQSAVASFLLENLKGRDHAKDLGINGRVILESVFVK